MTQRKKVRLDVLLVERGLVVSREIGRRLIMAGEVMVNGEPALKPGMLVPSEAEVVLKTRPRFVSRGGEKLAAALARFAIVPRGWVCADVGASTGGFTDCLLQAGAAKVYAIDVGQGQLAWSLRQDERVVVMENVNARYLEALPEPIDLACVDVSFISLRLILPAVRRWLTADGQVVALIKPQFEAGREQVSRGGVVRDPAVHRRVLGEIVACGRDLGLALRGLMPSPIRGPAGNIEFLLWLTCRAPTTPLDVEALIRGAVDEAHG